MGKWWTAETRPYDGSAPPPPWPVTDYRLSKCTHGWDAKWGVKGELQRRCRHCKRWVWQHNWPEIINSSATHPSAPDQS